jgi:hypothetical protein
MHTFKAKADDVCTLDFDVPKPSRRLEHSKYPPVFHITYQRVNKMR